MIFDESRVMVFDNAHKQRFLAAPEYLTDNELLIILTDITFWNDNFDDLQMWCEQNNSAQQGMTVVLPNKAVLTSFYLRWS